MSEHRHEGPNSRTVVHNHQHGWADHMHGSLTPLERWTWRPWPSDEAKVAELRRAVAAGLAGIRVTQAGQLCSGGREPIERGAPAYEDRDGWVWCPVHIPEPAAGEGIAP